jgi:hypothetical protein
MNGGQILIRALVILLALSSSCLLAACANPGQFNSDGVVKVGPVPVIKWSINNQTGQTDLSTPDITDPAYDSIRARWLGSDNSQIGGNQYADWRPGANTVLDVPEGAVTVEISLIDRIAPGGGPHLPAPRPVTPSPFAPALAWTAAIEWTEHATTYYAFQVSDCHDFDLLGEILGPVTAYGPGIVLPPTVTMSQWTTYDFEPDGLHVTSGTDGLWTRADIDINDGAWTATLVDLTRYLIGSWDMVTTVIPFEVLDRDEAPLNSVTYRFRQFDRPLVTSALIVGD